VISWLWLIPAYLVGLVTVPAVCAAAETAYMAFIDVRLALAMRRADREDGKR